MIYDEYDIITLRILHKSLTFKNFKAEFYLSDFNDTQSQSEHSLSQYY